MLVGHAVPPPSCGACHRSSGDARPPVPVATSGGYRHCARSRLGNGSSDSQGRASCQDADPATTEGQAVQLPEAHPGPKSGTAPSKQHNAHLARARACRPAGPLPPAPPPGARRARRAQTSRTSPPGRRRRAAAAPRNSRSGRGPGTRPRPGGTPPARRRAPARTARAAWPPAAAPPAAAPRPAATGAATALQGPAQEQSGRTAMAIAVARSSAAAVVSSQGKERPGALTLTCLASSSAVRACRPHASSCSARSVDSTCAARSQPPPWGT